VHLTTGEAGDPWVRRRQAQKTIASRDGLVEARIDLGDIP
jgi:hypothetical protein